MAPQKAMVLMTSENRAPPRFRASSAALIALDVIQLSKEPGRRTTKNVVTKLNIVTADTTNGQLQSPKRFQRGRTPFHVSRQLPNFPVVQLPPKYVLQKLGGPTQAGGF